MTNWITKFKWKWSTDLDKKLLTFNANFWIQKSKTFKPHVFNAEINFPNPQNFSIFNLNIFETVLGKKGFHNTAKSYETENWRLICEYMLLGNFCPWGQPIVAFSLNDYLLLRNISISMSIYLSIYLLYINPTAFLDGGLSTLCHSCRLPWLSLLRGWENFFADIVVFWCVVYKIIFHYLNE